MNDSETKNLSKITTQTHAGLRWADVRNPNSETFAQLAKDYNLHPLHLAESIQKVQHTQVEREDNYLFLVLHFPVFESHSAKIFAGQIGVFLGKDFLITIHANHSPFIQDVFTESQRSPERADHYMGKGPAYLLYVLISKLLGSIEAISDIVEGELDGIEGLVFENNTSDAQRIGRIRQKIVRLRRLIGPKRSLLKDLAEQISTFSSQDFSKQYHNNVKMVDRLWESIEEAKETVEIYKDADFTTSTEKTNKILMLLTLVFTFTIPISIVAAIYGMNVPLPGGIETGAWHFWGAYTSFGIVVAFSLLLALAMYLYFKKRKWF